jgi:uncharacterized membrane-anchored protein YitT (DUF2179 family)
MQGIQGESIEDDGIERHKLYEDALALITGTLFVSFGVLIYAKAELLVGGVAGMALLLHYVTGGGFGFIFFVLNLPFYVLAWRRMGWKFTVRTFIAVGLVSLLSRLSAVWVDFSWLNPAYAAVIGGALTGVGLLMLFRHRTGLGGTNILALFLQDAWGVRAGYVQLVIDLAILVVAFFVLPYDRVLLSIVGATIVNMTIAINHRPGRYVGVS